MRPTASKIIKAAVAGSLESDCKDEMGHAGRSMHQWIGYVTLKNIRHALAAGYFVGKDSGGTLVRWSSHFSRPYRYAIAHAAC
jgi:hypothetical protein